MDAGARDIPMNKGIKEILMKQREKQEKSEGQKDGSQDIQEQKLCFLSLTGKMIGHYPVNMNARICIEIRY